MFEFEFYPDQKVAEYKLKLIIIQMRLSQQVILNKEIVLTSVTWYDAVLCVTTFVHTVRNFRMPGHLSKYCTRHTQ